MRAIITKYLGPSDTKGSRIKASVDDLPSVTIHYDDALSSEQNHVAAAVALLDRLGWADRPLATGCTDAFYVHVLLDPVVRPDQLRRP